MQTCGRLPLPLLPPNVVVPWSRPLALAASGKHLLVAETEAGPEVSEGSEGSGDENTAACDCAIDRRTSFPMATNRPGTRRARCACPMPLEKELRADARLELSPSAIHTSCSWPEAISRRVCPQKSRGRAGRRRTSLLCHPRSAKLGHQTHTRSCILLNRSLSFQWQLTLRWQLILILILIKWLRTRLNHCRT